MRNKTENCVYFYFIMRYTFRADLPAEYQTSDDVIGRILAKLESDYDELFWECLNDLTLCYTNGLITSVELHKFPYMLDKTKLVNVNFGYINVCLSVLFCTHVPSFLGRLCDNLEKVIGTINEIVKPKKPIVNGEKKYSHIKITKTWANVTEILTEMSEVYRVPIAFDDEFKRDFDRLPDFVDGGIDQVLKLAPICLVFRYYETFNNVELDSLLKGDYWYQWIESSHIIRERTMSLISKELMDILIFKFEHLNDLQFVDVVFIAHNMSKLLDEVTLEEALIIIYDYRGYDKSANNLLEICTYLFNEKLVSRPYVADLIKFYSTTYKDVIKKLDFLNHMPSQYILQLLEYYYAKCDGPELNILDSHTLEALVQVVRMLDIEVNFPCTMFAVMYTHIMYWYESVDTESHEFIEHNSMSFIDRFSKEKKMGYYDFRTYMFKYDLLYNIWFNCTSYIFGRNKGSTFDCTDIIFALPSNIVDELTTDYEEHAKYCTHEFYPRSKRDSREDYEPILLKMIKNITTVKNRRQVGVIEFDFAVELESV